ncbi:MAG: hypothetical protein ACRDTG_02650 [Pseudonocardiaceae bacterium]
MAEDRRDGVKGGMVPDAMVVTVGTSPVPVLLTICQHEPSAVWLVHSSGDRGTAGHARRIAEVLGRHRPTMTVRLLDLIAEPGDFAAVRESLTRPRVELDWPPRVPWRCDYTGGTAVMAVELVAAHLAAHGPSRAGWRSYWYEAGGQVRYDDGDHASCRVPEFFDLVTVARLHGFGWREVKGFRSLDVQDVRWAESLCGLAHAEFSGDSEPDDPAGLPPADAALVRTVRASDEKSGKASGDALELIVAALLARAGQLGGELPRPDEVLVKFEVAPLDLHPGGDRVEIDVVARYGQQVLAVSCKNTSDALKNTAAAVGKVYQEAQALFGGATRRVLVTALAKSAAATGSHPVEPGFTDLLLGPGLTWRSPYVLTEGDLRRMLAEVTAAPRRSSRTPELSRMLRDRLGLGTVARRPAVALRDEIGPFDLGRTLVTTLSGNALAMVASGRGLQVRHIAVLEGASRAGADELKQALGAADATVDRVPVDMSDVPELIRRITWVIDCCARAGQPVVIDITGGTKAVSVAGYLAANAVAQGDVRLCYSDIWTGQRRWRNDKPKKLAKLNTSIQGLLNLSCRMPGAVEFGHLDDLSEFVGSDHPSERLLGQVMRRLTDGAGDDRILVRPKLFRPGEYEQNRDWLPRCAVLIAGNRLIGLYAHGKLTSMGKDKGLGEAMFVDALVAALGGDIARSLFVTSQDRDRALSTLENGRLRALVRRPFPPRVLCRADAEDVIHDDAELAELVEWMTA